MKRLFLLASAFILMLGSVVKAQAPQPLPLNPAVRTGQLDNGMTYYILHNNWPEGRASYFIAQRVGSLQEEETQLGLAHFLEHMCFNGTEHFPGNAVWDFVNRNGLNNNAETSFDRTTYHFDNVPNSIGAANTDSVLMILADWAHNLTLDASEIDKERDVIHGEYRMRMTGAGRILLTELPGLYPGRYGKRYPIGTMEVVDNFEHKEIVDYYHKWYNPENQAIIVVGDVDVDAIEKRVKELCSGFKANEGAGKFEEFHIDPTTEVYYSMGRDKDLQASMMRFVATLPEIPTAMRNTINFKVMEFAIDAASAALGYRFADITPTADCPWMHAGASAGCLMTPKFNQFNVECYPKEGKQYETYELMLTEFRRLVQYGVTQSEYDRFLQEYGQQIDNFEANKDKQDNSKLANDLAAYFYYGESFMAPDDEIQMSRQLAQTLPLEVVNQLIGQLISTNGQNSALWCWEAEKEGATYADAEQLKAIFAAVQAKEIEAPVDNSIKEPLMKKEPKPGKIKSEKEFKYGFKLLTLSNGVKVYYQQSKVEPNTIRMSAVAHAGKYQFEADEYPNFENAGDMPVKIGGWGTRDLQKLLAGKKVDLNQHITDSKHTVTGTAGTKDLETLMQLTYLACTDISRDDEMYGMILSQLRTILPNLKTNTDQIFKDSTNVVLNSHSPRYRVFEVEDIDRMDYDRMIEMLTLPYKNAANFDIIISGDFDEAELRTLLCKYIASLPSAGKPSKFRTLTDPKITHNTVCDFKTPMSEPKVLSEVHWINYAMEVTPENVMKSTLANIVLNNQHFHHLREEMSACYTPYTRRNYELAPANHYIDITACHTGLKPELADSALVWTSQSIAALAQNVPAEELVKAQETLLNNIHQMRDTRLAFYEESLRKYIDHNYDAITGYDEMVKAVTPESLRAWVALYLQNMVEVKVIARPE